MKLKNAVIELSKDREFGHKFQTNNDFWLKAEEIVSILKPCFLATKDMQKVGYGLSDFYISWLRIHKNLDRKIAEGTLLNLASKLKEKLNNREAEVFDTPSMVAAKYLDPRVKCKLSVSEKEIAIHYLKKILNRQNVLKKRPEASNDSVNNTLDELNDELADERETETETDENLLILSLSKYDLVKKIDLKRHVMEFWKENKSEFPVLYSLACIIHAIPAGQCLEERNFSSFSIIRNARRTKLSAANVQNILTIRLNKELLPDLKEEELDAILRKKI